MTFLLLLLPLTLSNGDWHQWRGPDRDGTTRPIAADWQAEPEKDWAIEVGSGYGAPVVADGVAYLLTGDGEREQLRAFSLADGKTLWTHDWSVAFEPNPYATDYGKGPFSTPLLVDGKLVALGVSGRVVCLDAATGKLLWQDQDNGRLDDERVLFCGNTVSPIAFAGMVIVHLGHEKGGRMTAYALEDGSRRWTWAEELPGYASPVLAEIGGRTHLITLSQNSCLGIDPKTGETLWQYPWKVQWRENIPDPIVWGNTVIISGRENGETIGIEVTFAGDGFEAAKRWSNDAVILYCASAVRRDFRVFGLSHKQKGQFFAIDARTGKTLWLSEGRQATSAQPLLAGDDLIFVTTEGALLVLDPEGDSFTLRKEHELASRTVWAYPVPLEDGLLIKDASHLTRWRF